MAIYKLLSNIRNGYFVKTIIILYSYLKDFDVALREGC